MVVGKLNGTELVLYYFVCGILGYVGYHLAETDRRALGRSPWGIPPAVWAILWFVWLPVGVILFVLAHRAEVRRTARTPLGALGAAVPPLVPEPVRSVGSDFPAYPRRADGGTTPRTTPAPAAAHTPAAATPPPTQAASDHAELSPPAWHPDPSGRFHYRWWTGTEWTSYVATHGRVETDTSPDQRIGPY